MDSKLLYDDDGRRIFAVVLKTGDEVLSSLGEFVSKEHLSAARLTAVGALSDVVLRYFDWEAKEYRDIPSTNRSRWLRWSATWRSIRRASRRCISTWWSASATAAPWPGISARRTFVRRWK